MFIANYKLNESKFRSSDMSKTFSTIIIILAMTFTSYSQDNKTDVIRALNALQDQIIKYEAEEGNVMMKVNEIDTQT